MKKLLAAGERKSSPSRRSSATASAARCMRPNSRCSSGIGPRSPTRPRWPTAAAILKLAAETADNRFVSFMRQQLSDTATQMFLERGFDDVRVTEIAEACGVSEKTVFNYFPTKESLILDRLEATMAAPDRPGRARDPAGRGGAADPRR